MAENGKAETAAQSGVATPVKRQIIWGNVFELTVIHLLALYGALVVLPRVQLATIVWRKWYQCSIC
jgi:hypothetical protein